jgi:hypothetical protein
LRLDSQDTEQVLHEFSQFVANLTAGGKKVFIVLSNPTGLAFDPPRMVDRFSLRVRTDGTYIDRAQYERFIAPIKTRLIAIASAAQAVTIDPMDYLCVGGRCPTVTADGQPLYYDFNHIRPRFARDLTFLDATFASD